MISLFDEEYVMKAYVAEKVRETKEEAAKAAEEAAAEKEKRSAQKLY